MNIAVYHDQPSGGARRALHGFCRELSRRHRVDVFTLSTSDQDLLRDEDVATSVTRLEFATRRPIRFGLYLNDARRLADLRDLDRVNAEAARRIDAKGYDVVLVDACRYTYAPYVLRHLRTPTVFDCHHGPSRLRPEWRAPDRLYERLRRCWHQPFEAALERRMVREDASLVRQATAVVTDSRYSREVLRAVYGVHAAICPPGVSPATRSRSETGATAAYVISVGALERHKGFDFVVRALATIPTGLRPPLHIVANDGNPRVRDELEALARDRGVQLSIRVRVDQADLADELVGARVFVYGAHQEPLGLAPLEALAHGVPVVAVAEGGVCETIEHARTGYLSERDPVLFGARVSELLLDEPVRRAMGARGRRVVDELWSWPRRAGALEAVLESVASRTSALRVAVG
jgi:glycosyltransferase involved in cell wall biosynthesis